MGGKQWKNRKHVLFYSTCFLIILILTEGCVFTPLKIQKPVRVEDPLEKADSMVTRHNFDGALKAYREVTRTFPNLPPGDRAWFDMGLICVHPDNPKKDYDRALVYFRRLMKDFPGSPLVQEARAWTDIIDKLIGYEGRIKDLKDKVVSCQKQINAMKEIDIGIEEKKREGSPEE